MFLLSIELMIFANCGAVNDLAIGILQNSPTKSVGRQEESEGFVLA